MAQSKRWLGAGVAVLVLALLVAGVYFRIAAESGEEEGTDAGIAAPSSMFSTDVAIAVEGAEVVLDTLVLSVSASGQAEAWRRTLITAEVAGRVDRVAVEESRSVGAGAILLALDPVDKQLALEEAEAQLARAEASYREQILFDANLPEDVRQERARSARLKQGVDQAEIAVKRARLDLERTRVRAPFPGRVASLKVVPGQLVQNGTELMTLVDVDPIRLQVQVLEGELTHLRPGGRVEVRFSAFPEEVFVGRIETINPLVEQQTRTAKVTVMVPNPDTRILPGMYARVQVEAQRMPDRILVPRSAILERDRRTMLFVHQEGKAKWRYVTTGLENDELVEIVANPETEIVRPGEVVLTGGHFTLTHDANVRLVDDYRSTDTGRPQ
ncbi:MAG TPA: efflux RND transporter periplasmic adaptor subunit [Longimicrobiales bacterium]|nr:efflux RND transporter periplasmic adaptor subunit [Longimicrobiales bacterium]